MSEVRFLHFAELGAPVALHDAAALEALIPVVCQSWPMTSSDQPSPVAPFATLRPSGDAAWHLELGFTGETREWDTIDTLCDVVAELAWERIRTRPDLLCLHAAAIDFGGRLVVFPETRRAGKSALTAALGRLGHPVFTDDFLPVEIDHGDRTIKGIANGILPRLRLPIPDAFSAAFRDWVDADPGPKNRRYKYMGDVPLSPGGSKLPLGAVVVLDRQDTPTPPRLALIARDEALPQLIRQNFARTQHSGRILQSIDALTRHLPLYRLLYSSAEEAAVFLHNHPELGHLPAARFDTDIPAHSDAVFEMEASPRQPFDPKLAYMQAPGLVEAGTEGHAFLSDGNGRAIHQLNAGSVLIWRLLQDPITLDEMAEILAAAFPDVDQAQIVADTTLALQKFHDADLIEAVQPGQASERATGS